ncbi:copper chaperone PCu(A)C [Microbulbifer sp. MLAF003]|uniref:copper chaperone PCu(A)C n=1 Tax=Microbulbifer sp. MLAF003 TaxID=3032582 RepID=UPI0024ADEBE4|nr:copper chaperone PCu(A)C [Microbulbifer sp. MLAF003]WHI50829.1 copper chaperone PCu(A)C [Microbulbifer sp. MLAF003]
MKKPVLSVWIIAVGVLLFVSRAYAIALPLQVEGYARETPPGAPMSAAYLSLHNTGEHLLLLKAVELRGKQDIGVDLHTTESSDGISRMRPLEQLAIAAGQKLQMAPGECT